MKFRLIILLALAGILQARAQEPPYSWKFRKAVTIRNTDSKALQDYQVSFKVPFDSLVQDSKIKPDKSDVRVLDSDQASPLCFWAEQEGMQELKIWVKIPELAPRSAKTIYFLYGNSNAAAASDADCTFMLFDDFNSAALDRNKWQLLGSGEPVQKNGAIRLNAKQSDQYILSRQQYNRPLVAEMKVNRAEGRFLALSHVIRSRFGWISGYTLALNADEHYMQLYKMDPSVCGAYELTIPHSMHAPSLQARGIWSLTFITDNEIMANWPDGDIIEGNVYNDAADMKLGLGVIACNDSQKAGGDLEVDWVRIRQYTVNEPSVQVGKEEKLYNTFPADDSMRFIAVN